MKKSNLIKIMALVLSMIFAVSALVACNPQAEGPEVPADEDTKKITINGTDISEYTLVYGKSEPVAQNMAKEIIAAVSKATGVTLTAKDDSKNYESGKEILVGHTTRTAENGVAKNFYTATEAVEKDHYIMCAEGDFFFLGGAKGSNVAITAAVKKLVGDITVSANGALTYNSTTPVAPENVSTYKIVTFNDGDNATTKTKNVAKFLLEIDPDIVGMQEVRNMDGVSIYPSLMKGYKSVYYDHDSSYYGAPILYKKDRFDLVDSGTKWLSDTPEEFASVYPESAYIRSYVFAILKDKQTGQEIVVINTHIDYVDAANTKQVAKLIELTEEFQDKLVIYTADWNMTVSEPGFKLMNDAGYTDGGNAYGKTIPNSGSYIDFIFVDTNKVTVNDYAFYTNHKYSAGRPEAASDHNPVMVEIGVFY